LKDPAGLFNSSLNGNVRRAIDIHEGDTVDEAALKDLIRAAVALNLAGESKPRVRPSVVIVPAANTLTVVHPNEPVGRRPTKGIQRRKGTTAERCGGTSAALPER
jgi:hypothetical protein